MGWAFKSDLPDKPVKLCTTMQTSQTPPRPQSTIRVWHGIQEAAYGGNDKRRRVPGNTSLTAVGE